jgi:hypothetical protein
MVRRTPPLPTPEKKEAPMIGNPTFRRRLVHTDGATATDPTLASVPASTPAQAPVQHTASDLLLPAQVAERLGVSIKLLERWRGTGCGPAFVRLSRKTLRYRGGDVDAFVVGKVCTSTVTE